MKCIISFIMALTMVLSLTVLLPINAAEIESEPVLSGNQIESMSQNDNAEIGEPGAFEEVENGEALAEMKDIDTVAAAYSSLKEITFSSHGNYDSVDYKSIKVQWLSVSGAESYRFYGKILDGEPGSGDNETGVMIYDKTVTKKHVTMSK